MDAFTSKFTLTARDIDTNLKAGGKLKNKAFLYSDYDYPVCPITANTYKTGKHGHAKTRLLLKDFFTGNSFAVIVDSDVKFVELEKDPRCTIVSGVITTVDKKKGQVKVLTIDYTQISVKQTDPEVLDALSEDLEIGLWAFTYPSGVCYKIKI